MRERFAEPVHAHIDALLAQLAPRGECELVEEFAAPFAIGLAGDVLGLPLDDVARVQEFYDAFAGAMVYDGDPEPQRRADTARAALNAILLEEVAALARRGPTTRSRSAVANDPRARALGRRDRRAAARDPVRRHRDGGVDDRERRAAAPAEPRPARDLRAEPGSPGNAIEEAHAADPARWPSSSAGAPCRASSAASSWRRASSSASSTVAANRDPAVFSGPERFDVRRGNARHHLTLSHGHHHCLGFNLGRMQCQAAVTALFDRLPGLEIVHAPEPTGFAFRRPATLELRWET